MIETARLLLQPFDEGDLPTLVKLRSDPEVARFIGGAEYTRPEKIAKRFQYYLEHQAQYGFSVSRVVLRETGEIIGWGGLIHLDNTEQIEVGYGFDKLFWGRGYATEVAGAWLRYGFAALGLERIVAVAVPENRASRHVMEKLGMRYEKETRHYEFDCVLYAMTKDEFLRRHE
jgi:ribosomal-protein-alanine N-acetyltransferase